jgi:hypothetical protein
MADFAAILKKTLDKMGETTPEVRAKVYDKARQTVQRQIDAMANQPPQAAIDRQFEKLESAIVEIEAGYAAPIPDEGPADTEPDLPPVTEPVPVEADQPAEVADRAPEPEAEPEIEAAPTPAEAPEDETAATVTQAETESEPASETLSEDEPDTAPDAPVEEAAAIVPEVPAEPEPWSPPTVSADDDAARDEGIVDAPAPSDQPPFGAPAEPEPTVDDVLSSLDDVRSPHTDKPDDDPFTLDTPPDVGGLEPSSGGDTEPAMPRADDHDPLLDFLSEERETMAEADSDADRAVDALFGEPVTDAAPESALASAGGNELIGERSEPADADALPAEDRPRRSGWLIAAAVLVLLIAGGGYAAYVNQEPLRAFLSALGGTASQTDDGDVPVRTVETTPVNADSGEAGEGTPAEDTPPETVDAGGGDDDVQKFTQRLTEDGREVDEGPAPGAAAPGEGSSVAGQTAGSEDAPAADAGTPEAPADDAQDGIAVGQRTIFYEERTGTQPGTAMQGSTVWSVAQESPGGDLPLEPAIRAQSSIPDLGIGLEVTIRRNGDATFPASHIVELFFTVPDTFEGRGIADVQRITFKNTEQDPGSALIAVPAPIDTNIFLVALTDAETAVQTNTSLMLSQGWVDIPMQYVSGRRALITLEKGAAGDAVFREVFEAWEAAPLGDASGG